LYQPNESIPQNILDFDEAVDDSVVAVSSAGTNAATITPGSQHSIFTARMLFLTPSEQYQRTDGKMDAEE